MWLDTIDKSFFEEKDRQKVWDAMKGKEPEGKLIDLLPTDKLKNNFMATIKSCFLEESYTKKSPTREEMHHLLVRKMLELTNQNSEYDTLLFRKVNRKVKRIHQTCSGYGEVF